MITEIKPNKLINEKSLYLLSHAHNPVNWYPWGEEAFKKAKEEDKPVFLSIGYSTCHWCHVMERESFEDEEVAEILNKYFVSIKVDREERPDIDSIYMSVCQAITGSGGWPLTIIMTPEQKPFFAGTYFPKYSKYNMIGLIEILEEVRRQWKANRDNLAKSGDEITEILSNQFKINKKSELSKELIYSAKDYLAKGFDAIYGGFGDSPKFPAAHNLMFLLRYAKAENDKKSLQMVEKTLDRMYRGGIFDHIGYGFSRYSVDRKWLVPHFEKMLYDNALLVIAYTQAYMLTLKPLYKEVARKVLTYIRRELTRIKGGFYSAQDADSEGVEGKYYVFTPEEIYEVLGEEDGHYFNSYFNITKHGNFEGKCIPNLIENSLYETENERIEKLCEKVYEYRLNRTTLIKDDKVLSSWNALMIVAFLKAYKAFDDDAYFKCARHALSFIEENLMNEKGRLYVRYRDGDSFGTGHIDDYAYYAWALLEFYETTFEVKYLEKLIKTADIMKKMFFDEKSGGFYFYAEDAEELIYRPKEFYDGAMPSGNSVALYVFSKLSKIIDDKDYSKVYEKQIEFIASVAHDNPAGLCFAMISLINELYPAKEIICVTDNPTDIDIIKNILKENYSPDITAIIKTPENEEKLLKLASHLKEYKTINGAATFYVCENKSCSSPFNDLDKLISILREN